MTGLIEVLGGLLFLAVGVWGMSTGTVAGVLLGGAMFVCGWIPFAVLAIRWRRGRTSPGGP